VRPEAYRIVHREEDQMDNFGIFDPRLVQRVKEEWERTKGEVRKATAPILDEAERVFEGVFHAPASGPTTPLDGYEWRQVPDDEEALRERLERTVADLTMVERQTVTLEESGTATSRFVVRVGLTDGTTWQARVPVAAVARATEAELRLWALRLAGKVRQ
jgi:hypothetical protein